MISEKEQELAIAYFLGELADHEVRAFEQAIADNQELAAWMADLQETVSTLATAVPQERPPAALRKKILEMTGNPPLSKPAPDNKIVPFPWFSSALAAGLILILFLVTLDDFRIRAEREKLVADLNDSNRQFANLQRQNALANIRIASLSPQNQEVAKCNAIVVWDSRRQEGVIKLVDLPKVDPGRDYQLWAIDSNNPNPVSAGVLTLGTDGSVILTFKPVQPVTGSAKFAISLEKAGGSPQPAGPVVLIGG